MTFQSPYSSTFYTDDFRVFLTIYVIFIAIVIVLAVLPQYIMSSIAYRRIAKRRGIKAPWLAWIPIARCWTIGALTDDIDKRSSGHDRHFRLIILIAAVLCTLAIIAFCACIAALVPIIGDAIKGNEFNEFDMMTSFMKLAIGMELGILCMTIGGVALSVLSYICIYKLYESLNPKYSLLFFLLSIFIGLFGPICLLCLRNKGYPYPEEEPALPEAVRIGWYES